MAASKLANSVDLNQMRQKIPPIENLTLRKPKKLLMTDSLVAPIKRKDVPNHTLNTSFKLVKMNIYFTKFLTHKLFIIFFSRIICQTSAE